MLNQARDKPGVWKSFEHGLGPVYPVVGFCRISPPSLTVRMLFVLFLATSVLQVQGVRSPACYRGKVLVQGVKRPRETPTRTFLILLTLPGSAGRMFLCSFHRFSLSVLPTVLAEATILSSCWTGGEAVLLRAGETPITRL